MVVNGDNLPAVWRTLAVGIGGALGANWAWRLEAMEPASAQQLVQGGREEGGSVAPDDEARWQYYIGMLHPRCSTCGHTRSEITSIFSRIDRIFHTATLMQYFKG